MKRFIIVAALVPAWAGACLWDDDTIASELSGKPNVLDAIVGRVAQEPPLYYQRRIEVSKERLKRNPADLSAYDNLAVAYDRLGDPKQALLWIQKKKPFVQGDKEHQYRTLANEGTFHAHLWLKNGRKPDDPGLKTGRKLIDQAIKLNPDAHFGREFAQLAVMDWLLTEREKPLADYLGEDRYPDRAKLQNGLAGLVHLGAAWQSLDVLSALPTSFEDGVTNALISLRLKELESDGKKWIGSSEVELPTEMVEDMRMEKVKEQYLELRANAKQFQSERTRYVSRQLEQGRHPDTHRDFWEGYQATPRLSDNQLGGRRPRPSGEVFVAAVYDIAWLSCTAIPCLLIAIGAGWRKFRSNA